MRLLDLFCGAGGAAMGYSRAGFDVVGVDLVAQPHYPFEFHQGDALEWPLDGFDVIHASPPCQDYSVLAAMHPEREWPRLIEPTRQMLLEVGVPWVMENVDTAPLAKQATLDGRFGVELCGSMFALGVERGYLRRHRLFESSLPVSQPPCSHRGRAVGVYGHGGHTGKHRMLYRAEASQALGIDWMTRDEMTQSIPPAYTEFIGRQLIEQLERVA
jgi:DNA (cytosine-5)-methyltransferase 1